MRHNLGLHDDEATWQLRSQKLPDAHGPGQRGQWQRSEVTWPVATATWPDQSIAGLVPSGCHVVNHATICVIRESFGLYNRYYCGLNNNNVQESATNRFGS